MLLVIRKGAVALAFLAMMAPVSAPAGDLSQLLPSDAEVGFDLPQDLACRDVTTEEFLIEHPGQRLLEVRLPVSLLLYKGDPESLRDVVIEIDGAPAGLEVFDYTPRTQLQSEWSEPIRQQKTVSRDKSLGATLGGKLGADVALTPSVSGGLSKTETETETAQRHAPKEAVLVSGTMNSRRGVFFKLRQSSQDTLEGEREFRITFVAPEDWPGGEMEVRCFARGEQKWFFVQHRRVWNETAAPVELRLVSHTVAKPVAGVAE